MEIVGGSLDLLLRLEGQLAGGTGGGLEHPIHLERAAHDDGVGGFLLLLGLTGGVLTVNGTHTGSGGGLELNVTVGQGGAAGAGGDGVVKHHLIQQQRAAAEHLHDLLIYLVGHADLCFC